MILEYYPLGFAATNGIILACSKTKDAVLIDAPQGFLKIAQKRVQDLSLNLKMILFTHSHWDHIVDAADLKKEFNTPLYIHKLDAPNLEKPGADGLPLYFPIKGVRPDHYLTDGQELNLGTLKLRVIHTPGHARGCVCFYIILENGQENGQEDKNILISGDTLFCGTIGRLDLPTSEPEMMGESLKKLAKLPKNTKVYPGHGEPTTIGEEDLCY